MVLESTMICLDNSEWMRNGDYAPRRLDAQHDAASMVCNQRINSNPENTVGLLTMASNGVDLLVSPTEEIGKILAAFANVHLGGKSSDLSTAVQIAQLALKHRKNKNGGQRIIAFVGGPLPESVAAFQKIGRQLKKNNVALDVISMGEIEENNEKLTELINATNSNDNSHLVVVPPGVSPINAIMGSAVMQGEGGGAAMMGGAGAVGMGVGGGDFDMFGGIDPEMDPELAMAIRVSTEEARAEEEARVRATQEASSSSSSSSSSATGATSSGFGGDAAADEDDEEALIQRALEMSMLDSAPALPDTAVAQAGPSAAQETTQGPAGGSVENAMQEEEVEEDDEEEELRRALELSVGAPSATETGGTNSGGFVDADFVSQLLGDNVDRDDPLLQAALAQLGRGEEKGDSGGGEDDKSKKRKGADGDK